MLISEMGSSKTFLAARENTVQVLHIYSYAVML